MVSSLPDKIQELINLNRDRTAEKEAEENNKKAAECDAVFQRFKRSLSIWDAIEPDATREFDKITVNTPGLPTFMIELDYNQSEWTAVGDYLTMPIGVRIPYKFVDKDEECFFVGLLAGFLDKLEKLNREVSIVKKEDATKETKPRFLIFSAYDLRMTQDWLNSDLLDGYLLRSIIYGNDGCYLVVMEIDFS